MIWGNYPIYAERNDPPSGLPLNNTIFMQGLKALLKRQVTMNIHRDNGIVTDCGNSDFSMRLHDGYLFCLETEEVEID
jgi:hypothetical protein